MESKPSVPVPGHRTNNSSEIIYSICGTEIVDYKPKYFLGAAFNYEVNCWFRHTKERMDNEENNVNENNVNNHNNMMQRIFKLMEDMTMRMIRIENMK